MLMINYSCWHALLEKTQQSFNKCLSSHQQGAYIVVSFFVPLIALSFPLELKANIKTDTSVVAFTSLSNLSS